MEKTLKVLNELEKAGLVTKYAIGGAIAVLFHAEPVLTFDMDVYCFLPAQIGMLFSLSPIYEFLKKRGYREDKEHVLIEGVPVQFIPAYNELIIEAVERAIETKLKRIKTRVVRVEHLMAIMLQTGRSKDRARLTHLLGEARVDTHALNKIINRHGLSTRWQNFKRRNDDN